MWRGRYALVWPCKLGKISSVDGSKLGRYVGSSAGREWFVCRHKPTTHAPISRTPGSECQCRAPPPAHAGVHSRQLAWVNSARLGWAGAADPGALSPFDGPTWPGPADWLPRRAGGGGGREREVLTATPGSGQQQQAPATGAGWGLRPPRSSSTHEAGRALPCLRRRYDTVAGVNQVDPTHTHAHALTSTHN
jgi:hypothetical protein